MKRKTKRSASPELNGKSEKMVYYHLNGRYVGRRIGKVAPEDYREGANFEGLRKQQSEFGMASRYSKVLRQALGERQRLFQGPECSGRLTGVLRECLKRGEGATGQRVFSKQSLKGLEGFAFDQRYALGRHFSVVRAPAVKRHGEGLQLYFKAEDTIFGIRPPRATHLIWRLLLLSPVEYQDGYGVKYPEWHGQGRLFKYAAEGLREAWTEEVALPGLPEDIVRLWVIGHQSAGRAKGWMIHVS